jgi:hypothetical protein
MKEKPKGRNQCLTAKKSNETFIENVKSLCAGKNAFQPALHDALIGTRPEGYRL